MGVCVESELAMPKQKTCKSAAKRFRKTGKGKIRRRQSNRNHLLQHKAVGRKRRLAKLTFVKKRDRDNVHRLLPYL